MMATHDYRTLRNRRRIAELVPPGAVTQKEFVLTRAEKEGISASTVWKRLMEGRYGVKRIVVNPKVVYIET